MNKLLVEVLNSKRNFYFFAFFLLAIKLWLVSSHSLMATRSPHDDLLFVTQAHNILSGNWLGGYNQFVMIKGPVYPLFIALAYWLNIPLLSAQQLLYWLASVTTVSAFYPIVRQKWLFYLFFLFLVFNPFSYNYPWVGRVYRLGIYPSLGLLVLSCFAGLHVRLHSSWKRILIWLFGAGVFLAAFWNTREESVWILPSLLFILISMAFSLYQSKQKGRSILRIGVFLLPLLVLLVSQYTLKIINQKKYGINAVIELKTPEFKSAYGGLLRIKSDHWRQHYPVVKDVRKQVYAVSPAFCELKPFLEGEIGKKWQHLASSDDIPAEFFVWAFRDAVAYAGYADNGLDALQFYKRMGTEIDQACQAGKLDCRSRLTSLMPPWHQEYNKLLLPTFLSIMKRLLTFRDFSASTDGMMSFGPRNIMVTYETVTREKLLTSRRDRLAADPEYHRRLNRNKTEILNKIGAGYQNVIPFIFIPALFLFFLMAGRDLLQRKCSVPCVAAGAGLVGILSIVFIMTLLSITSYEMIERPLHSAYPMVLFFIMTVFFDLITRYNLNACVSEKGCDQEETR
ncbi:MAG: hypothetical protein D3922_00205 [Candidatus Electrothrix sp. AR1]|nr:hypothetical protein [Candidatus Electrothrix sp. AR1]